jgi:hypothetical protein
MIHVQFIPHRLAQGFLGLFKAAFLCQVCGFSEAQKSGERLHNNGKIHHV